MGERRVGWSQLTLLVIVCWDPCAFCRRLTGSCSLGDRLQHYKTGAPSRAATHSSFVWLCEQVIQFFSFSPLIGSCLGSLSASVCHPKRVRRPLLRGVHRVCVSHLGAVWYSASPSRSAQCLLPLCGLYFGQTLCLRCTERCGVSNRCFASLSSSSSAPCCDDAGRSVVQWRRWWRW